MTTHETLAHIAQAVTHAHLTGSALDASALLALLRTLSRDDLDKVVDAWPEGWPYTDRDVEAATTALVGPADEQVVAVLDMVRRTVVESN